MNQVKATELTELTLFTNRTQTTKSYPYQMCGGCEPCIHAYTFVQGAHTNNKSHVGDEDVRRRPMQVCVCVCVAPRRVSHCDSHHSMVARALVLFVLLSLLHSSETKRVTNFSLAHAQEQKGMRRSFLRGITTFLRRRLLCTSDALRPLWDNQPHSWW